MLFNSYEYLIYFLPLTLAGFFLLGRARAGFAVGALVAASLFFYGWWNPRYLPLILASIGFNFGVGALLRRTHAVGGRAARARALLAFGVGANLALLAVFKYADFAVANAAALAGLPLALPHIVLPLGISFFTFTQIAYLVDVHRGRAKDPSLVNYALFVSFFPHLLAGPIIHHSEMMPQFASRSNKRPQPSNIAAGLFLLAIGLVKKVCIADPLAPVVAAGFDHPGSVSALAAWLAVLAYTLEIYFDFSGYTDMALGAARMFNIRLPVNFDSPYHSTGIREFWRRWHITLSRFLREYLYVPLGGNRGGGLRTARNVLVTFLLGGLWHGAAWTFVVWGALHGAGLIAERAWERMGVRLPRALAWGLTFLFVMIAWVFFRASSVAAAGAMLGAMLGRNGGAEPWREALAHVLAPDAQTSLAASAAALTIGLLVLTLKRNSNALVEDFRPTWPRGAAVALGLVWSVLQLGKVTPFLYFNF
ncbi:MAG TPA: MBOAT family O-acyltransferase [Casimicrobiaceae bacterium]|nr:MBOAT family O-acyltransferase [Casimicrobiaceae bacterium]